MDQDTAIDTANKLLFALIQHQPNFWPAAGLASAANYAKHLAAVRQTLIDELKKQPE